MEGNKADFIEKVVVEKEASCSGVCREGCPRQGNGQDKGWSHA